jgi:hypothetical protein
MPLKSGRNIACVYFQLCTRPSEGGHSSGLLSLVKEVYLSEPGGINGKVDGHRRFACDEAACPHGPLQQRGVITSKDKYFIAAERFTTG